LLFLQMPYIPLRNGQSVFIEDPQQAEDRYNQEWKQTSAKPQTAPVKPAAAKPTAVKSQPKPQPKPKAQRGFDLGQFLRQQATGAVKGVKRDVVEAVKGAGLTMAAGPFAPVVAATRASQGVAQTPIPGTKTTVGAEAAKVIKDIPRKAVNELVATAEQISKTTEGATPAGLLGGPMTTGDLERDKQIEQEKIQNAQIAVETLRRTGMTPDGFSYGIKPSTPLIGPMFSDDSAYVKAEVVPETAVGRLASSIGAAMLFDRGVSTLVQSPSMVARTGKAFKDIWRSKDVKEGLRAGALFLAKDVFPNTAQDLIYFGPEIPVKIQKQFEPIQQMQSAEERLNATKAVTASSPQEFDYYYEQFLNAAGGIGVLTGVRAAVGLRSTFMAANRFYNKTAQGVPSTQAMEDALDEVVPVTQQEIEVKGVEQAFVDIEDKLGAINTDLYRKIDENTAKIAFSTRSGAETFLKKQQEITPELQTLQQGLAAVPPTGTERVTTQAEIDSLQKALGVKTPEQVVAKQKMLEERLAAYEAASAADPEWINKSTGTGKRASKNSTKLRMATVAAERLQQLQLLQTKLQLLDNTELERVAKISALEAKIAESKTNFVAFTDSLGEARQLVNALDELDAERIKYSEARNSLLLSQGRTDEIEPDLSLQDDIGLAYKALKDLLNEADIAVASDQLTPEFVQNFVSRVDDIHNRIIDNGGVAPSVIEGAEGIQVTEDMLLNPRAEAPVKNEVPVTIDENGEVAVDTDELGLRRLATETPVNDVEASSKEITKALNKELNQYQNPTETQETLDDWLRGFDETLAKQQELADLDAINGTNLAEEATEIFNTNALKYTDTFENAAAVKAAVEKLNQRDPNLVAKQARIAISKLATTLGDDSIFRQMALLTEAEKFGQDVKQNLNLVIVAASMLDNSAVRALRSARDYKVSFNNPDVSPVERVKVLQNFKDNFMVLMMNLKALDAQFEGIGNALRLFSDKNQLEYSTDAPKQLFSEFNRQLASFGDAADFADSTSKAARAAKDDLNQMLGDLFNKDEFSPEEFENITNLVDKLYQTRGDLSKLKNLEITASAVLRGVQSGGVISAPHTAFSIPIMGVANAVKQIMGVNIGANVTGVMAEFVSRNPTVSAEAFQRAKLEWETINTLTETWRLALKDTYNSFLFGRSIADPAQAKETAYEMPKSLGLAREQAILDDLDAKEIRIPWVNWVYERGEGKDEIFDTINNSRVFMKVFHDYFIAGDRQQYRSAFGRRVLSPMTTAISNLQRKAGGGTASYYPGGEYANMSLPFRLAAAGDEFVTSAFANARIIAKAKSDVDSMINIGLIKEADRGAKIAEYMNENLKKMYQPVKVGLDQTSIGNSIRDQQFMEVMQYVNQTKELTGAAKSVSDAINELRYSDNRWLAAFANDMAAVVTSPLNAIQQIIRFAAGGEILQFGADVTRVGGKSLVNTVIKNITPQERQKLIDFESKYFSSDIETQFKARGALALAVGLQLAVFSLVRDGNQDITGGLENTYREVTGKVDPFTWKVGGVRIPYRYIGLLGDTIALHVTLRDMHQFGMTRGNDQLVAFYSGLLASYILETPGLAGLERSMKALDYVTRGDTDKLAKLLSGSLARGGEPYINLRKTIMEGIDPRKPASPTTRFSEKGWYKRNEKIKLETMTLENLSGMLGGAANNIISTGLNTFGLTAEYNPARPFIDRLTAFVKNQPEAASRKALWYGKPGETVNANHAGKWYVLQSILGRYWPFPDKLETDPVAKEIVLNLVPPPKKTDFISQGVGIDDTMQNNFEHFVNSEFEYTSDITGKSYKGIYNVFLDEIKSEFYQKLPSVDSPFKFATPENQANWERDENPRREYLMQLRNKLLGKAREQFIKGDLPGQRYKAPAEMKQFILEKGQQLPERF